MEVDIHQARQSVSALGIHDLLAFLRLCKGHDTPLPDGQAPLLKGVAGGINQSIFDDHILILTLSFVQPLSRACARQLPYKGSLWQKDSLKSAAKASPH